MGSSLEMEFIGIRLELVRRTGQGNRILYALVFPF